MARSQSPYQRVVDETESEVPRGCLLAMPERPGVVEDLTDRCRIQAEGGGHRPAVTSLNGDRHRRLVLVGTVLDGHSIGHSIHPSGVSVAISAASPLRIRSDSTSGAPRNVYARVIVS